MNKLLLIVMAMFLTTPAMANDYYCNGSTKTDSWGTYYPTGGKVFDSWGTYYPTGGKVFDSWGTYYPSGAKFFDSWGVYYPSGSKLKDSWGEYYPNGQKMYDTNGCYMPNGSNLECDGSRRIVIDLEASRSIEMRVNFGAKRIEAFTYIEPIRDGDIEVRVDVANGRLENVSMNCYLKQ